MSRSSPCGVHDAEAHDLRVEELIAVRRVAEDRREANPCAGLESRHCWTNPSVDVLVEFSTGAVVSGGTLVLMIHALAQPVV